MTVTRRSANRQRLIPTTRTPKCGCCCYQVSVFIETQSDGPASTLPKQKRKRKKKETVWNNNSITDNTIHGSFGLIGGKRKPHAKITKRDSKDRIRVIIDAQNFLSFFLGGDVFVGSFFFFFLIVPAHTGRIDQVKWKKKKKKFLLTKVVQHTLVGAIWKERRCGGCGLSN